MLSRSVAVVESRSTEARRTLSLHAALEDLGGGPTTSCQSTRSALPPAQKASTRLCGPEVPWMAHRTIVLVAVFKKAAPLVALSGRQRDQSARLPQRRLPVRALGAVCSRDAKRGRADRVVGGRLRVVRWQHEAGAAAHSASATAPGRSGRGAYPRVQGTGHQPTVSEDTGQVHRPPVGRRLVDDRSASRSRTNAAHLAGTFVAAGLRFRA